MPMRVYAGDVPSVSRLSVAPVKGLALLHPDEVELTERGVTLNRRFYLADPAGSLVSGIDHGPLALIQPSYDPNREWLRLTFPDGTVVEGSAAGDGDEVESDFYGRGVRGRVVEGPFGSALSRYAGRPLRLVRPERPGDACDVHVVTLLSDASVEELGRQADVEEPVDERRFRMLIGLGGCQPHEEDGWQGSLFSIGEAFVRIGGPVPRCVTTTRDPETGLRDLDTLKVIKAYRGLRDGKHLDFGVYGEVERPGRVRVGDPVGLVQEE
jgi:uncharacterized protein YcbX